MRSRLRNEQRGRDIPDRSLAANGCQVEHLQAHALRLTVMTGTHLCIAQDCHLKRCCSQQGAAISSMCL